MANRALVYTIYPNEKQNIQCQKTFGCCRFVYNQMLDVQKERHENGEKHLSKTKANTYCNQHLKKKYPFLKVHFFSFILLIRHKEYQTKERKISHEKKDMEYCNSSYAGCWLWLNEREG